MTHHRRQRGDDRFYWQASELVTPPPAMSRLISRLPSPRLWKALLPAPSVSGRRIEPVLPLDSPPPAPAAERPAPLRRRALEQVLAEGGQRVYQPMREAEVLEFRRR